MKFDLHNLPFLAGGMDWSGEEYPEKVTGFCPGLYMIKNPVAWGKNGYAIDAGKWSNSFPLKSQYDNATLAQPNTHYLNQTPLQLSEQKRWVSNWQWIGEGSSEYKNLID